MAHLKSRYVIDFKTDEDITNLISSVGLNTNLVDHQTDELLRHFQEKHAITCVHVHICAKAFRGMINHTYKSNF